jgi:hypothetical protein
MRKLTRKLILRRETVAMLAPGGLDLVRGAGDETGICTRGGQSLCAAVGCSGLLAGGCVAP